MRLSMADYEAEALAALDPVFADFFIGGAQTESTTRANLEAFERVRLLPRILRGNAERDLSVEVFGRPLSLPVMVSPTGFHKLAHPEGEAAMARGVAEAGTVLMLALASTMTLEDVAKAAREAAPDPTLWFQIYLQPDQDFTASLIRRAESAGYHALVITCDSPVFGLRERDHRNGFRDLPPGLACENMREAADHPGRPRSITMSGEFTWDTVGWLRERTRLPIVLKGLLNPEDARLAVRHGADAVMVSNHGGRQLDGLPATLDALPAVAAAVAGRIPVILDGGVRRGTDIVRALALGATAVSIGRPPLWGLALDGADGVRAVLDLLREDFDRAMALCGGRSAADLDVGILHPASVPGYPGGNAPAYGRGYPYPGAQVGR
jgi:4-hydroxymandelate oxidase